MGNLMNKEYRDELTSDEQEKVMSTIVQVYEKEVNASKNGNSLVEKMVKDIKRTEVVNSLSNAISLTSGACSVASIASVINNAGENLWLLPLGGVAGVLCYLSYKDGKKCRERLRTQKNSFMRYLKLRADDRFNGSRDNKMPMFKKEAEKPCIGGVMMTQTAQDECLKEACDQIVDDYSVFSI